MVARLVHSANDSARGLQPIATPFVLLTSQRYSASQNDNMEDSQNCRQTNPHVAPGKLFSRSPRLRSSRNVVLQPQQPALTASGRRQRGLSQQLYSEWIQQSRHDCKQDA